jgi:hypothetical protein
MYCLLIKFPAANINKIIRNLCLETVGRITTPLLKLSLTRVVIKVNIKRYRFMQI